MMNLHFRRRNHSHNPNSTCCTVVDICINDEQIPILNKTTEKTGHTPLVSLHWDADDTNTNLSTITITPDKDAGCVSIQPDAIHRLVSDQAVLEQFAEDMFTSLDLKLVKVGYSPLMFTFQHCADSSHQKLVTQKAKVFAMIKQLVSGVKVDSKIKLEIQKGKPQLSGIQHQTCHCFGGNKSVKSDNVVRWQDVHKQKVSQKTEDRLTALEEELFQLRNVIASLLKSQQQEYDDMRDTIHRIKETIAKRNQLSAITNSAARNPLNDSGLIGFQSLPVKTSGQDFSIATAYCPPIEIESDDDDDDEGEKEEEEDGVPCTDVKCTAVDDFKNETFERTEQVEENNFKENYAKDRRDRDTSAASEEDSLLEALSEQNTAQYENGFHNEFSRENKSGLPYTPGQRDRTKKSWQPRLSATKTNDAYPDIPSVEQEEIGDDKYLNAAYLMAGALFKGMSSYAQGSLANKNKRQKRKSYSRLDYNADSVILAAFTRNPDTSISDVRCGGMLPTTSEMMTDYDDYYYPSGYQDVDVPAPNLDPRKYNPIPTDLSSEQFVARKTRLEPNDRDLRIRQVIGSMIADSPHFGRLWESAEEALLEETKPSPRVELALDTVIVIDTSGTVMGEALTRTKKQLLQLINAIEDIAEEHDIEENIALVTFGGRARILHHLSNDYGSLRESLDNIVPGGPSPIQEGLVVAMAALKHAGIYNIGPHIKLPPRMILLHDGLPTTELPPASSDDYDISDQEICRIKDSFVELRSRQPDDGLPSPITIVSMGDSCNRDCLGALAACCGGTLVKESALVNLANYQRIEKTAQSLIGTMIERGYDQDELEEAISAIILEKELGFKRNNVMLLYSTIYAKLRMNYGSKSNLRNVNELPDLPCLGSRVVRGVDWKWGNQDTEGPGTIINHGRYNTVWVCWDNGHCNIYRYGEDDHYDVITVTDQPRAPEPFIIDIGVQVERGLDWHVLYGDQDGGKGSHGTIVRVHPWGKIMVRWQSGKFYEYRAGMSYSRFDLSYRDPLKCLLESTAPAMTEAPSVKEVKGCHGNSDEDYVWQRKDPHKGWVSYDAASDAKLKATFTKKQLGSCLVQRDGKSFRISFKTLQERALDGKTPVDVRRHFW